MKSKAKILVIDDDEAVLTSAKIFLKQKFEFVKTLSSPDNMEKVLDEIDFDLVLLDMNFSKGENEGEEGLALITKIFQQKPSVEIIPITAYGEIDLAVEAMRRGTRDFITKPWNNDKLLSTIQMALKLGESEKAIDRLKVSNEQLRTDLGIIPENFIGESQAFRKVVEMIEKVAPTDANVLILGENGTGKEMVAQAIHNLSDRKSNQLIKVDLGSLSTSLFESEMFGHKKGAFTDAKEDRIGKFELAEGSTLFLDEIGNLDAPQQAKLLSALQNRKINRVGDNRQINIDIRLISATNSDISTMVQDGNFRQDLLYRINTIEIEIPPLRERLDDISILLKHYLKFYKQKYRKGNLKIENDTIETLKSYKWPGNVRELAHAVERAVIMSDGPKLVSSDFNLSPGDDQSPESLDLAEMEKTLILKALEKNKGNITRAAKDLGIDRLALYRRLEKYGL